MKEKQRQFNSLYPRRGFMRRTLKVAAGLGLLPFIGKNILAEPAETTGAKKEMSRVCLVQSKEALSPAGDVKEILGKMLDEAIKFVSGDEDPGKFWKDTFGPEDRVAMKVNAVIPRKINFGPQITEVIGDRLSSAGVARENVVIMERETKSLKKAGYRVNEDGAGLRCYGTNIPGYCEKPDSYGEFTAKFSKIIDDSTAVINVPILKTHNLVCVSVALKNHYGSFENPSDFHANACDPFIVDMNLTNTIKGKQRLVVCDAMRVLYGGGPVMDPSFTEDFNGILVGTDPVAVDTVGFNIIKKIRKKTGKKRLPYFGKPIHIYTAAEKGLGEGNMKKINFERITV